MNRDMDLIREILLAIEQSGEDPGWLELDLPGRTKKDVSYQVMLLDQAGLIKALDLSTKGETGFEWQPKSLTWQGHEFLDAARDETIWRKAKSRMAETTGGLGLDVFRALLEHYAKQALGLDP